MIFYVLSLLLVLQCSANEIRQQLGSMGVINFPPNNPVVNSKLNTFLSLDVEEHHAIWSKYLPKMNQFEITMNDVDLGDNVLKVETAEFAGSDWVTKQELTGKQSTLFITITDSSYVRITLLRDEGSFQLDYEVVFCRLKSLTASPIKCDRKFLRSSLCDFQCTAPDYFPVNPDKKVFQAKCRSNMEWMSQAKTLEERCVSRNDLLKICLNKCKYKATELLEMFEEESAGKSVVVTDAKLADFQENKEDDVAPTTGSTGARVLNFNFGEPTTTVATTTTKTTTKSPTAACERFCGFKMVESTVQYETRCGDFITDPKKPRLEKAIQLACMNCRSLGYCQTFNRIVD